MSLILRLHASCAARGEDAVLLLGPSGTGKSDLLLRLIDRGFALVADDQVNIVDGWVSPPAALAGLVEARGLGILRVPYRADARLRLAVNLHPADRLPAPSLHPMLGVPQIYLDPWPASAAFRVAMALDCLTAGGVQCVEGAVA